MNYSAIAYNEIYAKCYHVIQTVLKYFLRVHLRVDKGSMEKALKQLTVRPYVLLKLLYFLIEQNHEVLRGKGNAK